MLANDETMKDGRFMVQARIKHGRVEVHDPIPEGWEGHIVNLVPVTADDPVGNLEELIAALHKMGPMELEADEREAIPAALAEMNRLSRDALNQLSSHPR